MKSILKSLAGGLAALVFAMTPVTGDVANAETLLDKAKAGKTIRIGFANEVEPNLSQTEQVEVVDHEGRSDEDRPTQPVSSVQ